MKVNGLTHSLIHHQGIICCARPPPADCLPARVRASDRSSPRLRGGRLAAYRNVKIVYFGAIPKVDFSWRKNLSIVLNLWE
jgi:hypothetical protein